MTEVKLNISASESNAAVAEDNRRMFRDHRVLVINFIGSPGCGKTSILEHTVARCGGRCAVIVGDVKTALDADRILRCDVPAYAIETGGGCHLNARQIQQVIRDVDLQELDFLFIENVGNLVCPSTFDLGEHLKAGVLSVPEGDEKVRKYPALFARTDVVFINKIDLLPYCRFDADRVERDCKTARMNAHVFRVSATSAVGFEPWFDFLRAGAAGDSGG